MVLIKEQVQYQMGRNYKTVYIYKGKEYLNAYNVVFDDNNRPHQVYQAPGVKRIYRIVSV